MEQVNPYNTPTLPSTHQFRKTRCCASYPVGIKLDTFVPNLLSAVLRRWAAMEIIGYIWSYLLMMIYIDHGVQLAN